MYYLTNKKQKSMKNLKFILLALFVSSILFQSCEKAESDFNYLESFSFKDVKVHGVMAGNLIEIYVPYETDYKNLIPLGEISEGANISPAFGQALDFTEDVIFTVTAEDGTVNKYTVRVLVETYCDFESFTLGETGYWNGSDLSGEYVSGNLRFKNSYTDEFGFPSWSGFAYSNLVNTSTAGFGNQYSVYAGAGAASSKKFGLACIFGKAELIMEKPTTMQSIYLTNSTYSALSMKLGDTYAKKFGGTSGTDADWFMLSIEGIDKNNQVTDTITVYLADYRSNDSSKDFVLSTWAKTDLTKLGEVQKLNFWLTSSDNGNYGMNTPAYFCIDNIFGIVTK